MSDLPDPLTPPECDLQAFPFMPLQVNRLRDSDLAAVEDPEACWYAVLLWAASWHQIPAASLPDDDAVLTKLCGLGRDVKSFRKFKRGALRGFIKCSDGRLYHPVVAEQALGSWDGRVNFRKKNLTAAERQARWREQQRQLSQRLRECGVTPPEKASKTRLLELLDEADPAFAEAFRAGEFDDESNADRNAPRNARNADPVTPVTHPPVTPVTPKRGTGRETGIVPPISPETRNAVEVERQRVKEAAGFVGEPSDWRLLEEWKKAGADLDQDILPTLKRESDIVMAKTGRRPFMLKYFNDALRRKLALDNAEIDRLARVAKRIKASDQDLQKEAAP